jgi:UDPglucose 6-dehydrogenase
MNIGIIGYGVVGKAVAEAFRTQSHTIIWHDKYIDNSPELSDLSDCECIFICVPTETINSRCDTSIVKQVIDDLGQIDFAGLIVIKSTVEPGTTQKIIDTHPNLKICFVPEFLHQDNALYDFMYSSKTLIVGTDSEQIFGFLAGLHAPFCLDAIKSSPTEAELVKYFSNNFNSVRVVFANIYYDVCKKLGADYDRVLASAVSINSIVNDYYLKCNENLRGFEGKCLPKDIVAFDGFVKELGLSATLLESTIKDNENYTQKK